MTTHHEKDGWKILLKRVAALEAQVAQLSEGLEMALAAYHELLASFEEAMRGNDGPPAAR